LVHAGSKRIHVARCGLVEAGDVLAPLVSRNVGMLELKFSLNLSTAEQIN
jgi:hypothetical protein